jgi:hypothetical protein
MYKYKVIFFPLFCILIDWSESREPKRLLKYCYTVSFKHFFKGIVSGGRGEIGHCGGINNPVHYTRYCTSFFLLILKKNKVNYKLF